jgi:1,4-alpha-glucan branching enzyme
MAFPSVKETMRKLLVTVAFLLPTWIFAQVTVTPAFPTADEEITIVYNAAQGTSGLVNASGVKMHAGVVLSSATGTNWSNVVSTWGNPSAPGTMTSLGNNQWQIKITPRSYFNVAAGVRIYRIGMVFRETGPCGGFGGNNTSCKEGKSGTNSDIFVDLFEGSSLQVSITEPLANPLFKNTGETLTINAASSKSSDLTIKINGTSVAQATAATQISYVHTVTETSGLVSVVVEAVADSEISQDSFDYIIRSATTNQVRPAGIRKGINYGADPTKGTLVLWAPLKTSVYAVGDFSDWRVLPNYQMKKDGEYFWIELTNLTPSQEYAFQYLVDETLWVADPFADKILDLDDHYIPSATYPNLKAFPAKAKKEQWYYNRLSVFQTAQTPFAWQTQGYQPPPKENLIVYEILLRDFFSADQRNYQNLMDTLSYLKRLGVNTIQLMPIMEFNGNEGWGYNPTFMLAPDKYYGTKNKLKELVDKAHSLGLAVILDIAMNHHDVPNPMVMMYFDFATFKPVATNPWFNTDARHPFNVFFDMNHESAYTKSYLDSINDYWLTEYKIDGFRYDLSKGFTQKNSGSDVGAWSAKDDSRITLLKRMGDKVWSKHPKAILILEHFADNAEEIALSDHGFLLWGNLNDAYARALRGASGGDLANGFYKNRSWTKPHLVTYMESHDEERIMYNALTNGNSAGSYSTRNLNTALERLKGLSTFFYLQPGPKMLWQFGELGFDYSINRCPDGSINGDCRLAPKPVAWNYVAVPERDAVYDHIADIISFRNTYPVFNSFSVTFTGGSTLLKQMSIKGEPYNGDPQSTDEMNVHVVGNFDVTSKTIQAAFPHVGTWYGMSSATGAVVVSNLPASITLAPGEVSVYTDVPLSEVTELDEEKHLSAVVYPNPSTGTFSIDGLLESDKVTIHDALGNTAKFSRVSANYIQLDAPSGVYILVIQSHNGKAKSQKIMVQR